MRRPFVRLAGFTAAASAVLAAAGCSAARPMHHAGAQRLPVPTSSAPASHPVPVSSSAVESASSTAARRHAKRRHAHKHQHVSAASSSAVTSTAAPPPIPPPPPPRTHHHRLTVVINPGHNGGNASHPDEMNRQVPAGYGNYKSCDTTGTETDSGYPEHAFNWDVSLRIARILRAQGVRVVLTRHSDTGVGPCVDRRTYIGNHPWDAAVVSIHADGAPSSGHGFHVNQDSRIPDGATRKVARESRVLGRYVHDALASSSGLVPSTYIGSDGYVYRDDFAGLDLATRPATFLELGNMKNAGDASLQSSAKGRQRIAASVAVGILDFLGRS